MSVAPKGISEITTAERYKLTVASELVSTTAKTDAYAAHTKALRGLEGLAEGEGDALLKQSVETFFQPTMPTHERVKAAKALLRAKAAELGYGGVNELRKALGEAIVANTRPIDVAAHMKTLGIRDSIELGIAAVVGRGVTFDADLIAGHLAKHLGLTVGLDDLKAAVEKVHLETWATLSMQDRIDLSRDVMGQYVVPWGAATVGEIGNAVAPLPPKEVGEARTTFGKRKTVPGGAGPRGPDAVVSDASEAAAAKPDDLPQRARFKQLPLNEQYQAILGTVVLRSFGAPPRELHEKAERIFEMLHPHRGESPDIRKARRIDANRTFLAPGQGEADNEKQMLGLMLKRAKACGLESTQELIQLVTSMADYPARLDAELFNTEPAARLQALASAVALTGDGLTAAQLATAKRHGELMKQRMFMATGMMMPINLVPEMSSAISAPTAEDVATRLAERLTSLGLPRDEAAEKGAVDALFAAKDFAETTQLARANLRAWAKGAGQRFSVDVVEALAGAAAPNVGPPEPEDEERSPLDMLRGAKDGKEVDKKKSFTSEIPSRPVADIIAEVKSYAGWEDAKEFVDNALLAIEYDTFCREAGLPSQFTLQHLLLKGPPGTGKTTFAKLYAELLHAAGLLPANQVTRAKATDMVSRYLGGTAHDTQKILDAALGGVLFIDEIYRLARVHQYGQEAIDAINEFLDEHRDEFVCVCTGYERETNEFLERNPGLKDRFGEELFFPAFSMETMLESVTREAKTAGNAIDKDAWPAIKEAFGRLDIEADDFASGRTARKMFEEWQKNMKVRVVPEARAAKAREGEVAAELLTTITAADIRNRAPSVTQKNPIGFVWSK